MIARLNSLILAVYLIAPTAGAFLVREGESAAFVKSAAHTSDLRIYKITLDSVIVNTFLPHPLGMSASAGIVPRAAVHRHSVGLPLRVLKHFMVPQISFEEETTASEFFGKLKLNQKYTYVVLSEKMVLTETCNEPNEQYKDLASKHVLLSGLKKYVRFAGEMHIENDRQSGGLLVLFDNASGTYRPPSESLPNLAKLLIYSLLTPSDNVKIIAQARS